MFPLNRSPGPCVPMEKRMDFLSWISKLMLAWVFVHPILHAFGSIESILVGRSVQTISISMAPFRPTGHNRCARLTKSMLLAGPLSRDTPSINSLAVISPLPFVSIRPNRFSRSSVCNSMEASHVCTSGQKPMLKNSGRLICPSFDVSILSNKRSIFFRCPSSFRECAAS